MCWVQKVKWSMLVWVVRLDVVLLNQLFSPFSSRIWLILASSYLNSIFLVASLGFLGLGVQPPSPDWGLQINEARNFFSLAPWVLLFPACTIALLVIATNLMSDGLRQVMLPGGGRN